MKRLLLLTVTLLPLISHAENDFDFESAAGSFSIGAGVEISSGKYGGQTATDIFYLPVMVKYSTYQYALSLTVPYINISSDNGVVPGAGGMIHGNGRMMSGPTGMGSGSSQSGLGDVIASAGYNLYGQDALTLNLVGNVKFGTANAAKGLGTGANDYAAQMDGFYAMDSVSLYASAGYNVIGAPVGYTLNNYAYASGGIARMVGDNSTIGLTADAAQSASATSEGRRSLTFDARYRLNEDAAISASLARGLSSSSADWMGGLYFVSSI